MVDNLRSKIKNKDVVLTSPLSLQVDSNAEYKAPNILQRVFSLFSTVRPGSDLTRFQLPPSFNLPKSQLQCYGETVYSVKNDLLSKCAAGETAVERMIGVVAWSISTFRPLLFGVAPYNPILGETHHVSRATLNILLEQVSHHPPISALHATDETNQIELLWCQHAVSKFKGATIETVVHGTRKLNVIQKGESYVMNCPKLVIRLLPKPGVDWVGTVKIKCQETGLEAELTYKNSSFLGLGGGNNIIKGKLIDLSSSTTLYDISGHWDRIVEIRDTTDGQIKVLYNAIEAIAALPTPTLRNPDEGVWASESALVWGEVSKSILNKEWEKAREAKRAVEENERELSRRRNSEGIIWLPKHFVLSHSPQNGWNCSPIAKTVPPAPIISSVTP